MWSKSAAYAPANRSNSFAQFSAHRVWKASEKTGFVCLITYKVCLISGTKAPKNVNNISTIAYLRGVQGWRTLARGNSIAHFGTDDADKSRSAESMAVLINVCSLRVIKLGFVTITVSVKLFFSFGFCFVCLLVSLLSEVYLLLSKWNCG